MGLLGAVSHQGKGMEQFKSLPSHCDASLISTKRIPTDPVSSLQKPTSENQSWTCSAFFPLTLNGPPGLLDRRYIKQEVPAGVLSEGFRYEVSVFRVNQAFHAFSEPDYRLHLTHGPNGDLQQDALGKLNWEVPQGPILAWAALWEREGTRLPSPSQGPNPNWAPAVAKGTLPLSYGCKFPRPSHVKCNAWFGPLCVAKREGYSSTLEFPRRCHFWGTP